jgi:hypothetical protein
LAKWKGACVIGTASERQRDPSRLRKPNSGSCEFSGIAANRP